MRFCAAPTLLAMTLLGGIPALARAQTLRPSTTGLSVAVSAAAVRATSETDGEQSVSNGVLPRLEVSYGATPRFSLVAAIGRSAPVLDGADYSVRNVDLGMRYLGYAGRVLRPFVEGGLSIRKFSIDNTGGEITSQDVGPWGAAGGMWFPGSRVAIEGALTYGSVQFESWRVPSGSPNLLPVTLREVGVRAGIRLFQRAR
jgi:hypothetical protein